MDAWIRATLSYKEYQELGVPTSLEGILMHSIIKPRRYLNLRCHNTCNSLERDVR